MKWQAVAKSVPGVKHLKSEQQCQDFSDYRLEDNDCILIGAVSDGMGSAEHSSIGSEKSVKFSIDFLIRRKIWHYKSAEITEQLIEDTFKELLSSLQRELIHYAEKNQHSVDRLACTLIVFIASTEWLAAMQVGDGQIVVSSPKGPCKYELLFQPDKGEYHNETTSITSNEALQTMQWSLKNQSYTFICAATDGIENISLTKKQKWEPHEPFFDGLLEAISSQEMTLRQKEKEFEEFLNREELNKRTNDDKTLLLGAYSDCKLQRNQPENDSESGTFHNSYPKKRPNSMSVQSNLSYPPLVLSQPKQLTQQDIESLRTDIYKAFFPNREDLDFIYYSFPVEVILNIIKSKKNKKQLEVNLKTDAPIEERIIWVDRVHQKIKLFFTKHECSKSLLQSHEKFVICNKSKSSSDEYFRLTRTILKEPQYIIDIKIKAFSKYYSSRISLWVLFLILVPSVISFATVAFSLLGQQAIFNLYNKSHISPVPNYSPSGTQATPK